VSTRHAARFALYHINAMLNCRFSTLANILQKP
jgi:hypothetical protein